MSDSDLVPFGAAVAADVLSAFQLPGGSSLTKIADAFIAKRRREAANMLIAELSNGHHGPIRFEEYDLDPLIEIICRFSKAVAEGAARENLRLLAQVIAGLKKHRALEPDRFRKWANVLEHLTRDELVLLGRAYTIAKRLDENPSSANTFSADLPRSMADVGYDLSTTAALCSALCRTGILVPDVLVSGMAYKGTAWLLELGRLAELSSLAGQPVSDSTAEA
jgi:hypothetical protein